MWGDNVNTPMDIVKEFPVRKSKKQKQIFRDAVQSYAEGLGYAVTVEKGSFGARNVIFGDPENASILVTAHYDTCARLPIPNLITPCNFLPFLAYQLVVVLMIGLPCGLVGFVSGLLAETAPWASFLAYLAIWAVIAMIYVGPANPSNVNDNTSGVVTVLEIAKSLSQVHREKVCFVLFDLEEAGLLGSSSYRAKHKKATNNQTVINLDCVGEGDHIRLFPTKKLKKDRKKLTAFYKACGYFGQKDILVHEKGFSFYPSDQAQFPYGVGIAALNDSKFGLYLGKIHTPKDTVLDITNVNLLRAAIATYIQEEK